MKETKKKGYKYGKEHHRTKKWDLYEGSRFIGTYDGLAELCSVTGHSPVRAWQMANGYNGNFKKPHPHTDLRGFTILKHGEEFGWWLNN